MSPSASPSAENASEDVRKMKIAPQSRRETDRDSIRGDGVACEPLDGEPLFLLGNPFGDAGKLERGEGGVWWLISALSVCVCV